MVWPLLRHQQMTAANGNGRGLKGGGGVCVCVLGLQGCCWTLLSNKAKVVRFTGRQRWRGGGAEAVCWWTPHIGVTRQSVDSSGCRGKGYRSMCTTCLSGTPEQCNMIFEQLLSLWPIMLNYQEWVIIVFLPLHMGGNKIRKSLLSLSLYFIIQLS